MSNPLSLQRRFDARTLTLGPQTLKGVLFGLLVELHVPAATWAVVYGLAGRPQAFGPGTYWLAGEPGRGLKVQWVDGRRRRLDLPPLEALTADGWRLTLEVTLIYQVADPLRAVALADPIALLASVGHSLILDQVGTLRHQDLIALLTDRRTSAQEQDPAVEGVPHSASVFRRLEQQMLAAIQRRPALEGIQILDFAITRCEGDEQLTAALQAQALERIREVESFHTALEAEPLRRQHLLLQAETAEAQGQAALAQAQTQLHLAHLEAQLRKIQAQTEAELAEMRAAHERELRILEYQHAETLALIQGTAQIAAEAARQGVALPWPGSGPTPGAAPSSLTALQSGLEMLDALREKRMPSLPMPTLGASRLVEEERRLKELGATTYELQVQNGHIREARLQFRAPDAEGGSLTLVFTCPEGYPQEAPTLHLHRNGVVEVLPVAPFWQPGRFLAEVANMALAHLRQRRLPEEEQHGAA